MMKSQMQMLVANGLLTIVLLLIFPTVSHGAYSSSAPAVCTVSGKYQDLLGHSLGNINLMFGNKSTSKSVRTDSEGNYNLTLPTGIYNISVKQFYNLIFYRRAVIDCHDELVINIYPLARNVSYGVETKGYDHEVEVLGKSWTGKGKLNIMIAYLTKKKQRNTTVYQGKVYVTYDKYCAFTTTVYKDGKASVGTVTKDEKNKTLTVEGWAWIENGSERKEANKIVFHFGKSGAKVTTF